MVEENFNISPSQGLRMGSLWMIIASPWLKKTLIFHLHEGLEWAYFEWLYSHQGRRKSWYFTFTSRRVKMCLLWMIIVSPWLKKILTFHLHEGLKWAYFEWLYHYTLTMVEENFEISPLWKSWKGLLRMLIDSPWLKKILESYVLKCTRMALEVCRLMLNIFCKLRKTPPLWHVYAAPPKLFFAPPASLTLKWYASRLPYELSPLFELYRETQ